MPSPCRRFQLRALRVIAGLAVCGLWSGALWAEDGENNNPFRRADTAAATAPSAGDADLDALQFSGISTIGKLRSFNFTDSRTRKSFWVPLNGTENDITVMSYDETNEQVIVRHGARTRPIALRKAVLVAAPGQPTPTPKPVATTASVTRPPGSGVDEIKNPKTPAEIKQAEYEARMLVSDLLDISMKAREEQRKLREAQQAQAGAPAPR